MNTQKILAVLFLFIPAILVAGCKKHSYDSPSGYDFNAARITNMKHNLDEISGICFTTADEKSVNAIEDEHGKMYTIDLENGEPVSYKFSSRADYEDLAFWNNTFFVLSSNGHITRYSRPSNGADPSDVVILDTLLPAAEYEGMAVLKDSLFVLAKVDKNFDQHSTMRIYRFIIGPGAGLSAAGIVDAVVPEQKKEGKNKAVKFHPSCLAKNPADNNWYVISSINKQLFIFDDHFNFLQIIDLDPSLFRQPEGLTFNSKGDMLVSNEANGGTATILYFKYSGKK